MFYLCNLFLVKPVLSDQSGEHSQSKYHSSFLSSHFVVHLAI